MLDECVNLKVLNGLLKGKALKITVLKRAVKREATGSIEEVGQ